MLTLIRRNSTATLTIDDLLKRLAALEPSIGFVRTYEDEVQGAFDSAQAAVQAILLAAVDRAFWAGLGVGELKIPRFAAALGTISTPECSGDALDYSRLAVERAQTGSPAWGGAVLGSEGSFSAQASGLLRLLYRVSADRSEVEDRVISLMVPGVRGQQKAVAQELGISAQAVSKTLVRSMYQEQQAAVPALAEILIRLDSSSD